MIDKEKYSYCAVSSRVRLARNLIEYPFGGARAMELNAGITDELINTLRPLGAFTVTRMDELRDIEAEYLKDRYIISPLLAKNKRNGAVIIKSDESFSFMVNEEDHLREQCVVEGFDLEGAYSAIAGTDKIISARMPFAKDAKLGYITACLTNIGTGMRASVMLFLPALCESGKMNRLIAAMKNELGLTVRGVFGEGSRADGRLFQISNEITFGYTENEIIRIVNYAAKKLCDMELYERDRAYSLSPLKTEDECCRAWAILTNCRLLNYDEFSELYVKAALGAYYGLNDAPPSLLYNLFVNMRPAALGYREKLFSPEDRAEGRAKTVRNILRGIQGKDR